MEQLYNGTTSSSLTHIQLKSSKMGKMGEKNIWRNYGWIIYILDNTLKPQTKSLTNVKHEEPWKKTMPRDTKRNRFQEPRSQPLLSPKSRANTILPTTCVTHLKADLVAPTEATPDSTTQSRYEPPSPSPAQLAHSWAGQKIPLF